MLCAKRKSCHHHFRYSLEIADGHAGETGSGQMHHNSLGIALKTGATLAFSLMYVVIRLAGNVPVGEVIFFRSFFSLIPLFALAMFTVGPAAVVSTRRPL